MKHYPALLFVPAKEKMLSKLPLPNVEANILDLEDSIEEDDKETPYMDIYDSYYINPKGEEDIASTLYSIYIKKEQILTY